MHGAAVDVEQTPGPAAGAPGPRPLERGGARVSSTPVQASVSAAELQAALPLRPGTRVVVPFCLHSQQARTGLAARAAAWHCRRARPAEPRAPAPGRPVQQRGGGAPACQRGVLGGAGHRRRARRAAPGAAAAPALPAVPAGAHGRRAPEARRPAAGLRREAGPAPTRAAAPQVVAVSFHEHYEPVQALPPSPGGAARAAGVDLLQAARRSRSAERLPLASLREIDEAGAAGAGGRCAPALRRCVLEVEVVSHSGVALQARRARLPGRPPCALVPPARPPRALGRGGRDRAGMAGAPRDARARLARLAGGAGQPAALGGQEERCDSPLRPEQSAGWRGGRLWLPAYRRRTTNARQSDRARAKRAGAPLHAHCSIVAPRQRVVVAAVVDATTPETDALASRLASLTAPPSEVGDPDGVAGLSRWLCADYSLYWRREDLHDPGAARAPAALARASAPRGLRRPRN